MGLEYRTAQWDAIQRDALDVVVVGGGINGAAIFHHLCAAGYRVLLVEKGDFASGTSQSSAMMIWGGLIHLRRLNLITVGRLCASRDRLIREKGAWVHARTFRYLPTSESGRKRLSAYTALYSYWLLGRGRRARPRFQREFTERSFLNHDEFSYSLEYEEACVEPSDARFVLEWVLPQQSLEQVALNYCNLQGGTYDRTRKEWRLELADSISGREAVVRAKWVVNAAGTWTDHLNERFQIKSPYRHIFSKGVFIGLKRYPQHQTHLMIEASELEDCMSLIPWGPVSLWGPTETRIANMEEGFSVQPEDVRYLLKQLNRHLSRAVSIEEIVSLRCGVRPLGVNRSAREPPHTFDLSRKYRVHQDRALPWISVYGGKLTSCVPLAKAIAHLLRECLKPRAHRPLLPAVLLQRPELEEFPNINEKVPSARWCAEREMCWSLEDYLRRRTNVSQWVARGGLGSQNENAQHLMLLAGAFQKDDKAAAEAAVRNYQRKITREFDEVLANVN
jgi:glycerol-3-phosphate dehydrogenase